MQRFKPDHDEMLKVAQRDPRRDQAVAPERAVFGLPHNYFFSSLRKPQAIVEVNGDDAERRASPLFLHLHHPANAPPIVILAFLPAKYSPASP